MSLVLAKRPKVGDYVRMFGEVENIISNPRGLHAHHPTLYELVDSEAWVELVINGKKVADYTIFNNIDGKGSCRAHAIEDANRIADHYDLTRDNCAPVDLVVYQRFFRSRFKIDDSKLNPYNPQFFNFGECVSRRPGQATAVWTWSSEINEIDRNILQDHGYLKEPKE